MWLSAVTSLYAFGAAFGAALVREVFVDTILWHDASSRGRTEAALLGAVIWPALLVYGLAGAFMMLKEVAEDLRRPVG